MIIRHPAEVAFSLAAAANDSTVLICFAVPQPLPGMKREEEAEAAKGSISNSRRRSISPMQQGQTGLNCVGRPSNSYCGTGRNLLIMTKKNVTLTFWLAGQNLNGKKLNSNPIPKPLGNFYILSLLVYLEPKQSAKFIAAHIGLAGRDQGYEHPPPQPPDPIVVTYELYVVDHHP